MPVPAEVLVVDDDRFLVSLLLRMLRSEGVSSPRCAYNGVAALAALNASMPNLVLCDLSMPGMDGLEFVRHLASYHPAPGLVLMSGADRRVLNTARQLAEAHNLRVIAVLSKPVTASDLRDVLSRVLPLAPTPRRPTQAVVTRLTATQVQEGIAAGAVRAHYQPKVRCDDLRLQGVEALLRWHDPLLGALMPVSIIGPAEEFGLMDQITLAMLKVVLADAPKLLAQQPDLSLAVNVSAENLKRLDFTEQVVALLHHSGIDSSRLMLEVTESRLLHEMMVPVEILTRLRLKGVALSIDDYGTGASTLQQLRRVPATEIKIDRSFVNAATSDPEALMMLESSLRLARDLGLTTVAEGVESREEMALVTGLGCDLAQGFYIQRPVSLDALLDWMQNP